MGFFLLRREAVLAFFEPEAGLIDSGFTASVGADGDCEADGWEVWVSVLCAACGDVAVPDKNGNKMKTVARVIQESRVAVKSSYAFVRHLPYQLPRDRT